MNQTKIIRVSRHPGRNSVRFSVLCAFALSLFFNRGAFAESTGILSCIDSADKALNLGTNLSSLKIRQVRYNQDLYASVSHTYSDRPSSDLRRASILRLRCNSQAPAGIERVAIPFSNPSVLNEVQDVLIDGSVMYVAGIFCNLPASPGAVCGKSIRKVDLALNVPREISQFSLSSSFLPKAMALAPKGALLVVGAVNSFPALMRINPNGQSTTKQFSPGGVIQFIKGFGGGKKFLLAVSHDKGAGTHFIQTDEHGNEDLVDPASFSFSSALEEMPSDGSAEATLRELTVREISGGPVVTLTFNHTTSIHPRYRQVLARLYPPNRPNPYKEIFVNEENATQAVSLYTASNLRAFLSYPTFLPNGVTYSRLVFADEVSCKQVTWNANLRDGFSIPVGNQMIQIGHNNINTMVIRELSAAQITNPIPCE